MSELVSQDKKGKNHSKAAVNDLQKGVQETAVTPPTLQENLQHALAQPEKVTSSDVGNLQHTLGNRAMGLLVQSKLAVGPAGDKYEQEADAVAKQVVSQIPADGQLAAQRQEEEELAQMMPLAQRQEEEELQLKPQFSITPLQRQEDEEEMPVQAAVVGAEGGEITADLEQSIQSARSGGQPLGDQVRAPMEQAFGADFSGVRVHTGGQSDALNRSIQARAFTTGQDIFFRSNEYNPGSRGGQELLAHELTHVVQQTGAVQPKKQQPGQLFENAPGSEVLEHMQALRAQPVVDSALYRKEIAEFQRAYSPEEIRGRQQQLLPGGLTQTADNSRIFRACGGSSAEATSGGITDITLDVTFAANDVECDGLQAVQVWWGSGNIMGVSVGNMTMTEGKKTYEAFVDGGKNSPWVTLSGESPAHPTKPYYLTAGEVAKQVDYDSMKKSGTIRIYDKPTAVVNFDDFNFETAVVAINYKGTGKDKVLQSFTWGWSKQGTVPTHAKGDKIEGKSSGIKTSGGVSSTFRKIVSNDYPDYKFD